MLTKPLKEAEKEFKKERRAKYHFCDAWSQPTEKLWSFIAKLINKAYKMGREEEKRRAEVLIAEEIIVATKEGQSTSRLTSLAVKLSTPKEGE